MTDIRPTSENQSDDAVPTEGCLLGIDFGTKRIGFAMCDDRQVFATPLETYSRTVDSVDAKYLAQLCIDYRIRGIVIGLALHMSGDESSISHQARNYGSWAADVTGLPIVYWDERFSSAAADVRLLEAGFTNTRKDSRRDMLAAQAILQSFIDAADRNAMPTDRR